MKIEVEYNGEVGILNLKGELEHEISLLNYKAFYIFRPSLLLGNRKENRPGERFAQWISQIIPFIGPWKKYKPINAQKVAEAMIKVAAQTQKDVHLYESEMMQHM